MMFCFYLHHTVVKKFKSFFRIFLYFLNLGCLLFLIVTDRSWPCYSSTGCRGTVHKPTHSRLLQAWRMPLPLSSTIWATAKVCLAVAAGRYNPERVLRRSCPSSYFLAPEGTILGLSGDKYMIWYEYIYLLLYSAYEADCRTAFCKLGVNTCPSIHRSAGLPSVLIRKENGERGQIMPGLGRTKGCREFLILESRWSDLDTENRKFCYLHMHTLPGSEEYLQLERFPDFIVFSQLKTVTVECTACCHEPDKSTSSRVLGRLGTCLLE